MSGILEVIAARVIASGIVAGIKKAFQPNADSLNDKQLIKDSAIEVFYKGNYIDCIASGNNSDQVAELKIESRSNKTLLLEVHGYAAPINGGLLGPFSTYYQGVEGFSVTNTGSPIVLKPNGSISFDLAPFAKTIAGRAASVDETSRLLFDVPESDIVDINSKGESVSVEPVAYSPPLPTISAFEGTGITLWIRIGCGDVDIYKCLFGGWARKNQASTLLSIDKKGNGFFMLLDGFNPAGYSFTSTNGNNKEGRWVKDDFTCLEDCVGAIGKSYQGRVVRVGAFSDTGLCPLFSHALLVTNAPTPINFDLRI